MKHLKVISVTAIISLILGAVLFYMYGPEKTQIDIVEKYVSKYGDIEQIIDDNPDIREMVLSEAEKRAIRDEIAEHESRIDELTTRLLEIENEGFLKASTAGMN